MALQAFARTKLPDYSVPSAVTLMDSFPTLPSGKVDRAALPRAEARRGTAELVPASTKTEHGLSRIWCEVLGIDTVSVGDDFFELGGHSLLATRVISRVATDLGKEIPLRVLFEAPTIAALARRIDDVEGVRNVPAIERAPRDGELPLSFAQERLWFIDRMEPGSSAYNIPISVRLIGRLELGVLRASLDEIVRRHEVLRTVLASRGDQVVQVIQPVTPLPLPLIDLSALRAEERSREASRWSAAEALRPFDLASGPLIRAELLRLAPEQHIGQLTLHHIATDGWSTGLLIRELAALYRAYAANQPSPLVELPVQYADFARWQRQWLEGEEMRSQLAYWRAQLSGAPPVLELPTDRPRPAVRTFHGATEELYLTRELSDGLIGLSRREGTTLFMTLLAAYQVLLSRYSGQRDISVGTPVAGRNYLEIEDLIGFFINTLVLRGDLSGDPSFQELLGRVREVVLDAQAHQNLPFEKVVEELEPERSLSHTPLFQVWFALQNVPREVLELPDLEIRTEAIAGETSKFDLNLSLGGGWR